MKKAPQMRGFFVGETGFEPATLWSQTRCATELRYSPIPIYGVTPTGLEPVTYCLEGSCSIQLSYEVFFVSEVQKYNKFLGIYPFWEYLHSTIYL